MKLPRNVSGARLQASLRHVMSLVRQAFEKQMGDGAVEA